MHRLDYIDASEHIDRVIGAIIETEAVINEYIEALARAPIPDKFK